MLVLIIDYFIDLTDYLTSLGLLTHEVSPWELIFDLLIEGSVLGLVRVCVEDVQCKPASSAELYDLKWGTTWRHGIATCHQIKLFS